MLIFGSTVYLRCSELYFITRAIGRRHAFAAATAAVCVIIFLFFGYFGLVSHHVMNSLNTALNQLLFRKIYDTNSVCTVTAIQSK